MNRRLFEGSLLAALILFGIVCRVWFRDIPNFMPVAAISLFAGYVFRSRLVAAMAPLGIMLGSDLFLEKYQWQMAVVVYAAIAFPLVFGGLLRNRLRMSSETNLAGAAMSVVALFGCSLFSSLLFFALTNFAWWPWSSYAQTWDGLIQCYSAGLPFFRYTLAGDLGFAAILFGGYALALRAEWVPTGEKAVARA